MIKSLLFVLALLFAAPAIAHDYKAGDLHIDHPWMRATPEGAKVAGGYMSIKNAGQSGDRLLGGSVDFAERVEIHEMAMVNDVMTMRPLAKGLELPAGKTIELKPGSYHVMFMGLKSRPLEGQKLKGTLQFERAGSVAVEFAVEAAGKKTGAQHHH